MLVEHLQQPCNAGLALAAAVAVHAGMVFDQGCNCCKPPTDSSGFDSGICSSIVSRPTQPQQQPPAPGLASAQTDRRLGRRLYAAEPLSSESLTYASDEERMKARAKARARLLQRRRRREAAARATAAATAAGSSGDSLTSDPSSSANRHLDNGVGVWNSYGKKYRGPWMSRNIVKEPAFRAPVTASSSANATATPAAAVLPTSGSGDAVANHHHHRLLQQQATAEPAVASSAETESTIPAIPSITVSRHLQRKRIDPSRTESGGVGAAAVAEQAVDTPYVSISSTEAAGLHNHPTVRHGMRPMDKRPAAKAVDPQDEQGAAFAGAIAGTDGSAARRNSRPVHIRRQRPAQPFAV